MASRKHEPLSLKDQDLQIIKTLLKRRLDVLNTAKNQEAVADLLKRVNVVLERRGERG